MGISLRMRRGLGLAASALLWLGAAPVAAAAPTPTEGEPALQDAQVEPAPAPPVIAPAPAPPAVAPTPAPPAIAPAPAPPAVAPAPAPPTAEAMAERQRASEEFRATHLNLLFKIYLKDGAEVYRRFVPRQGEAKVRLKGEQFYELLGEPELALQYRKRRRVVIARWVLVYSGTAMLVGGALMLPLSSLNRHPHLTVASYALLGVGGTAFASGTIMAIVMPNAHPMTPQQAKARVIRHNRALRKRLGLAKTMTKKGRTVELVGLGPTLTRGGAGFGVSARF